MSLILVAILAFIVATTVRVIFLEIISSARKMHIDMIKAVGTLYHGSYSHVLLKGIGQHYLIGFFNAFIYLILLTVFQPSSVISSTAYGGMIGLFHGVVVSFTLTVIVDENHPIPEFRKYGYEVVIYYLIAQVIYGLCLGAIIGTVLS